MSTIEMVALQNPTYKSDFWAVSEMLERTQLVNSDDIYLIELPENAIFIVQYSSGQRYFHLNKLFAIHHFLSLHYRNEKLI